MEFLEIFLRVIINKKKFYNLQTTLNEMYNICVLSLDLKSLPN